MNYVQSQGGTIVEAYPHTETDIRLPDVSSFMGFPGVFKRAGFEVCRKASESKPIMRRYLKAGE